jgi:periplasmic protein TonB
MKTQETITAQMDEIIFENRNKLYGAYILRKMYNKHLYKALLLAVTILLAGLAYPVVSGYNIHKILNPDWDGTVELSPPPVIPDEVVPPPPPPPPPTTELQKKVAFVVPDVITGEVLGEIDPLNMDDFIKNSTNEPINLTLEPVVEKQKDIIEEPIAQDVTFMIAEEMPAYPGGESERQKFLTDNIQYPPQAAEIGLQGTIYLEFVVDSKGNITNVKILRGIGSGCDEEAVRVIKMMPQWHPGKQNGKPVRVLYHMAIGFQLRS